MWHVLGLLCFLCIFSTYFQHDHDIRSSKDRGLHDETPKSPTSTTTASTHVTEELTEAMMWACGYDMFTTWIHDVDDVDMTWHDHPCGNTMRTDRPPCGNTFDYRHPTKKHIARRCVCRCPMSSWPCPCRCSSSRIHELILVIQMCLWLTFVSIEKLAKKDVQSEAFPSISKHILKPVTMWQCDNSGQGDTPWNRETMARWVGQFFTKCLQNHTGCNLSTHRLFIDTHHHCTRFSFFSF